jgi:hypothetical protein
LLQSTPAKKHAFGVDDGSLFRIPFPVPFSVGVTSAARYRVILAKHRSAAFHNEDAQMKRALVQRSGSVAIAVLNEKLSASAPFQVAAVDVVGDLVVEEDAPKKVVLGFESRGIRIHWAKRSNC